MEIKEITKSLEKLSQHISIDGVSELDFCSKSLLKRYLENFDKLDSSSLLKIQAVIDYMYEQVNIGNWREVKQFLRKTITLASYLKLLAYLKCSDSTIDEVIKEAYKIIDFGILFGCPLNDSNKLLQSCASVLNSIEMPFSPIDNSAVTSSVSEANTGSNKCNATNIEVLSRPSMEYFYKNHILSEKPVVLNDCMSHWPALNKWKDPNYLIKLAGLRTVSIELGNKYTDSDWTQKLMTIEEFIRNHIQKTSGLRGYLAQYQLFEHIPELCNDICEPEYCCFSNSDDPIDLMAWFGPKGTVSPLHHDPKKNFLAQVVGEKQIFLFSPNDSDYVYPHEHELLVNTAKVDPREVDEEKYPKYKNAKPFYCVLSPGQMLYIPQKWWHFVESLSTSFSVSFWWE